MSTKQVTVTQLHSSNSLSHRNRKTLVLAITVPKSWPVITTSGITSNGRPTPSTLRDPRVGKLSTSNSVSNSTESHPALIQKCLNNAHYLKAGKSKHGTAVSDNGRNRHGLRNTRLSLQRSFPRYCRMTRLQRLCPRNGPFPWVI